MPYYSRNTENISPDTTGRQGFVYLLTSKRMPNIVKIGATRKHPLQRAQELSAGTGVPEPYTLAYFRDYADSFLAETLIHNHFAVCRINESREFFAVTIEEVIQFMNALPRDPQYREGLQSTGVTGGSYLVASKQVSTPWADLFSTFPDDGGGRELTQEEQTKCRTLAAARHCLP